MPGVMKNTDCFKNKRIIVVGLARSGLACANLLFDAGARVRVTDCQDNPATRLNASRLKSPEIKVELGRHSPEFIKEGELMVISPGVSERGLPVVWAKESGIPVISEIEAAWALCPAEVIAVTGTNGKTTVTTLIGRVLKAAGRNVSVCGNIGNPFSGEISKLRQGDFVSLEISSFQLEAIKQFKPKVAVVLNFSPNHLDRYPGMKEYIEAKKRIFMNQDQGDYLVLNSDDPRVKELAGQALSRPVYFRGSDGFNPNFAAVMAVASVLGIKEELVKGVLRGFKGIEHRMEEVARINNVVFINDSKSTTVDAGIWALKNVKGPVVLIAGGREKGNDYAPVIELMRKKVKEVILIGEAKEKMKAAFGGALSLTEADSLDAAVRLGLDKAGAGGCVLLSPMCKSFDMFSDYEERGRVFKDAVSKLAKGRGVHGP